MKTSPTVEDSGWNVSFWFAVTSPLLGVLLGFLALMILYR
jgi:RsiW-degrading membrane proteinase PrsW (M82 family)